MSIELPPRSLYVRAATEAEGGSGLMVTCDCGESCLLTFAGPDGADVPPGSFRDQEIAYTCDNCLSVTWLTLTATRPEQP